MEPLPFPFALRPGRIGIVLLRDCAPCKFEYEDAGDGARLEFRERLMALLDG